MKVLLLTGPGGDAQGWGDMAVTKQVEAATRASGYDARIAWVDTEDDFNRLLDAGGFDIIWSALYHITANDRFIGANHGGTWVADVLDRRGIPYIGSNSQTMKDMIDKFHTHQVLAARGVLVPAHHLLRPGDDVSHVRYPAFVKPMGESRSVGVTDESVVNSESELRRQIAWIDREFHQPALVEDFLPGDEFTALVLGNGDEQTCLPGMVDVESRHYGRHKVLRADLRGVGLTRISDAGPRADEVRAIAMQAANTMRCLDHVRIDVKTGADGGLRIMEVNGIPGMKPFKSWGPQLCTLHFRSPGGGMDDYRRLVKAIIDSGCRRFNLPTP
jgi:glutathione synthase/RimK-type ligase-like ATP-grasp enzyme